QHSTPLPYTTLFRSRPGQQGADEEHSISLHGQTSDIREDNRKNGHHQQRVQQRPYKSQGRAFVTDAQLLQRQRPNQLSVVMDFRSEEHTSELQSPYD